MRRAGAAGGRFRVEQRDRRSLCRAGADGRKISKQIFEKIGMFAATQKMVPVIQYRSLRVAQAPFFDPLGRAAPDNVPKGHYRL